MIMATQTFQIDCGYDLCYDDFGQYDLWYDHDERVVMILNDQHDIWYYHDERMIMIFGHEIMMITIAEVEVEAHLAPQTPLSRGGR